MISSISTQIDYNRDRLLKYIQFRGLKKMKMTKKLVDSYVPEKRFYLWKYKTLKVID